MNRILLSVIAISLGLHAGCGGDGGNTEMPGGSTCSGSVSGSVSATITDCSFTWSRTTAGSIIGNSGHISSTADDDNQFYQLGFDFNVPSSAATPRTLDGSTVTSLGGGLQLPSGGGYSVSKPAPNQTGPTYGTLSMKITSVEATSNPDIWNLHGTLSAGLETPPGVTAYSGSAKVTMSF